MNKKEARTELLAGNKIHHPLLDDQYLEFNKDKMKLCRRSGAIGFFVEYEDLPDDGRYKIYVDTRI